MTDVRKEAPDQAEKRARALEKIKKCIALSGSSNPHEAEAAMRQARKLMEKYRLEISDVHAAGAEEYAHRLGKSKSRPDAAPGCGTVARAGAHEQRVQPSCAERSARSGRLADPA